MTKSPQMLDVVASASPTPSVAREQPPEAEQATLRRSVSKNGLQIGILALQGDVAEHAAALCELDVRCRRVSRPQDLLGLDGIVLPGGESTTMSLLLESSGLAGPLAEALSAGLPAFGTCAGMILLSRRIVDGRPDQLALGAIGIEVRRNGWGRQVQSFEADVAIETGDQDQEAFPGVFIRAPAVEAVDDGVEVIGTVSDPADGSRRAPVLCRQGNVLVCSFHPELTSDRRVHRMFLAGIEQRAGCSRLGIE